MKSYIKAYLKSREQIKLTKYIKNILSSEQLTLLDIGAAGDMENRWKRISPLVNYIGFEPDERSYNDLLKNLVNVQVILFIKKLFGLRKDR